MVGATGLEPEVWARRSGFLLGMIGQMRRSCPSVGAYLGQRFQHVNLSPFLQV